MRIAIRNGTILSLVLLLVLVLLSACGGNGDDNDDDATKPTVPTATQTTDQVTKTKITIGNHTDKTGVAANALAYIDAALVDVIEYYNENNLIPGVEVGLAEYDGQADPAKDIPGYEWLKDKGADVITAWFPAVAVTLRPYVDADGIPLFGTIVRSDILYPPGHLFITSALLESQAWTMIKWVAENDWDYQTKGPAKIGGVCWDTDDCDIYFNTFEKYAELYPDQVEWVSGHIAPAATFMWSSEVEALKHCDYVWVPNALGNFVREYRQAGHTGKFLGTSAQLAFWGLIEDMGLWDEVDGSLFLSDTEWWDETGEVPDFINQLLRDNHPDSADEIMRTKSYFAAINVVFIMEIIKSAAENVGPENLDSQAIYDAAQSATLAFDGLQRHSFTETKRASLDRAAIYVADGAEENIVRISDWISIEAAP
ncbi:MAG: ABC transporter substrate-binding protein [Chloroflexi bacterium]|nr:ABC transporter substrate-binding protein [Chloroflexota bacterium]